MTKRRASGFQARYRASSRLRRGAAVVEMAVVTPLLLTMLFGVIEFGWVFMVEGTITNATREACREAALPGSTNTDVNTRLQEALHPAGLTTGEYTVTLTPSDVSTATAGTTITVKVQVPYSQVSLLGSYLGLSNTPIGSVCSMRKEG